MNAQLLNPFTIDIPDSVAATLETADCSVCSFNHGNGVFKGQYLAVGRTDGLITIWDLETRSVLRILSAHVKTVSSLCWSSYNRYLASSSTDGNVVVWDLSAKSVAGPVTTASSQPSIGFNFDTSDPNQSASNHQSQSQSQFQHHALPFSSERKHTVRFDAPVSSVNIAPGDSRRLLVVLSTQEAYLVDLTEQVMIKKRRRQQQLNPAHANGTTDHSQSNGIASSSYAPATSSNGGNTEADFDVHVEDIPQSYKKIKLVNNQAGGGTEEESGSGITSAKFTRDGRFVVAGTSRGSLYIFDAATGQIVDTDEDKSLSTTSGVKELSFDAAGRHLVVNCGDRAIRILSVTTKADLANPFDDGERGTLDSDGFHGERGKRRKTGLRLILLHKIQDMIQRTAWVNVGFSPDSDYIFAGAAHKAAHNVYIWDRSSGTLVKILEGPKDWLVGADWHPSRPVLASVSNTGTIYVWFTPTEEIWSAYAPGFEELEENEEYQEREDEFDFSDLTSKDRIRQEEQEAADVRVVEPKASASALNNCIETGFTPRQLSTLLGLPLTRSPSSLQQQTQTPVALSAIAPRLEGLISSSDPTGFEDAKTLTFTVRDDDTNEAFVIPPRLEDDFSDLHDELS
ncbi:WD40 repeat-like protein [Testicularia cyperi]|uniref:WD40 repeat-like protein n=1 Tax=Testicularia cyperi TaxID=1882483 RepID=A0A317Y000_9BASI|nr:WD40 repeat-like protein [Testicularia cyperi]